MPVRDHFRPPVTLRHPWPGIYTAWPMQMIHRLNAIMPENYIAEPHTYLGKSAEVDVATFEDDSARFGENGAYTSVSLMTMAKISPTFTVETDLANLPEFEILIYDLDRARQLVVAIEIVSPANKDRVDHRRAFVSKWSGMLQREVCVIVVDPVTVRQFNLYADLMTLIGTSDPGVSGSEPAAIYAVSTRIFREESRSKLNVWQYPLAIGEMLPTMPLWLTDELCIPLDFEAS